MFRHPKIGTFFQAKPQLHNPYLNDGFLQRVLRRMLPADAFNDVNKDLGRFGQRLVDELEELGDRVELNQPYLRQFDAWGNRVDQVVTDPAWTTLKHIAAEEGLVATGYERKYHEFSRLCQFAKVSLYAPSSGLWSCPLAMTDGAAKVISDVGLGNYPELKEPYQRLTSRNPKEFWSSGQWMTERRGGSDVGTGTETIAVPLPGNEKLYSLHGYKWFTSATDADMSFTLARIQDDNGQVKAGSQGLSMFFLKTRREDGSLNNMQIMKLKNKLGTRQLPTGELLLDGTESLLASPPGRGVAGITGMLSVTRLHNAVASVSGMRRITQLLRDYSKKRECFGQTIAKMGLHLNTLSDLEVQTRAGTVFTMELSRMFGVAEVTGNEFENSLVRLLTPLGKLYFGKICMRVISEGLEGFGGNGYIEDTGLPKILRDMQVTPIWEGTTNILSLDVLRAVEKSKGVVLVQLREYVSKKLDNSPEGETLKQLLEDVHKIIMSGKVKPEIAREFAFGLAEITTGAMLLEHARSQVANDSDKLTAKVYIRQIVPLSQRLDRNIVGNVEEMTQLVYDSYSTSA